MKENVVKIFDFVKKFITENKSLILKILPVIIALIAVLIINSGFKSDKYGNSVGNSNNNGLAAEYDKWIYYVEVDGDDTVGICKVKNNGKKTEKVAEGDFYNLNILDGYIYCLEHDSEENKENLVKLKTNGKKKEVLARDVNNGTITVTEKWIYYYKNTNLYRMKLDGTEKNRVSDKKISYYQIDGKWIYYIYKNENISNIARMKLNGEDAQRIAKAEENTEYDSLYVKGSKVYYVVAKLNEAFDTDYYLYKMSKTGEKADKICRLDTNIKYINMQEDEIYYTTTENYSTYIVKSIKYNGTNRNTIKKTQMAIDINVTEDWVLFLSMNEDSDTIIKMVSKDGEKEKDI